jgi:sugar/nucleoside kinase (ribokinase family)
MRALRIDENSPYTQILGVGGIGTGVFFALEGNQTLGRNESRPGRMLDVRDYCKLHIVFHYVAKLLNSRPTGCPFHVQPIGNVGDDEAGRRLVQEMKDVGMDVSHVRPVAGKPTLFSVCFQYPDGHGGNITTSNSAAAALEIADLERECPTLFAGTGKRTMVLAAPEVPLAVRHRFLELATRAGAFRAASFVGAEILPAREAGSLALLDLLALNQSEAAELVGCEHSPERSRQFSDACLKFLRSEYPRLQLIVTAGEHGAYAFAAGDYNYRPAPKINVVSSAGAGDALLGGVLASIASGVPLLKPGRADSFNRPLETALDVGVLLASYTCLSPHTIHPSASVEAIADFAVSLGLNWGLGSHRLMVG